MTANFYTEEWLKVRWPIAYPIIATIVAGAGFAVLGLIIWLSLWVISSVFGSDPAQSLIGFGVGTALYVAAELRRGGKTFSLLLTAVFAAVAVGVLYGTSWSVGVFVGYVSLFVFVVIRRTLNRPSLETYLARVFSSKGPIEGLWYTAKAIELPPLPRSRRLAEKSRNAIARDRRLAEMISDSIGALEVQVPEYASALLRTIEHLEERLARRVRDMRRPLTNEESATWLATCLQLDVWRNKIIEIASDQLVSKLGRGSAGGPDRVEK